MTTAADRRAVATNAPATTTIRPIDPSASAPTKTRRKSALVVAGVGAVVVLVAIIASNSHPNDSSVQPIQVAPLNVAVTPAETQPAEPVSTPAVDLTEPVAEPAPTAEAEPPPLEAANVITPVALVPSLEPAVLDVLFFGVGSSRAEVVAAQGRPPTYAAHHDRMLGWGSSRVEFDQDGNVVSWVDGTPALNVYRR